LYNNMIMKKRSSIFIEQLNKCKVAKFDNYDSTTKIYHIKRFQKVAFNIGHCYLISIADYLVNNTTTVTAVNWNNSRAPQHKCYKIYVSKKLGSMIYFDGAAVDAITKLDLNAMWSGWLDSNDITLEQTLS